MANSKLAAPEMGAVEIKGISRSAFILRGAVAAGAVYGAGTVGPFVGEALGASSNGDVDILNFALTLEYLEATFYKDAESRLKLSGTVKTIVQQLGKDEQDHVTALTKAIKQLGGKPASKPTFKFPFKDEKGFLKLASTLEDTGVGAYNGAGPMIKNKAILKAAGSIVQIEGRHASLIRLLGGQNPSPNAFDQGLPKSQVLSAVKPLIKSM